MTQSICDIVPRDRRRPYIEDMEPEPWGLLPSRHYGARDLIQNGAQGDIAVLADPEIYAQAERMSDRAFLALMQARNPISLLRGDTPEAQEKKREYNQRYWRTKLKKCPDRHHKSGTNNGERTKA